MLFRLWAPSNLYCRYTAKNSQYTISHGDSTKRRFICSPLSIGFCCSSSQFPRAVRIVLSPYPCLIDSIDRVNTKSFVDRTVQYISLGIEKSHITWHTIVGRNRCLSSMLTFCLYPCFGEGPCLHKHLCVLKNLIDDL